MEQLDQLGPQHALPPFFLLFETGFHCVAQAGLTQQKSVCFYLQHAGISGLWDHTEPYMTCYHGFQAARRLMFKTSFLGRCEEVHYEL